jgi:3-isopropylmalate/(R)-2-methylmalate dehydratase small subunit
MNLPKAGQKITRIEGHGVHVPGQDIDTDRIIPARFMKCVEFSDLGPHVFEDIREDARKTHAQNPSARLHPLDRPEHQGASILIVDGGFGAGSSREHAPQALLRWGIRAIIALSFNNGMFMDTCTVIGIVCATVSEDDQAKILLAIQGGFEITVDLESGMALWGRSDGVSLLIQSGARQSLMEGSWDALVELMQHPELVDEVAKRVPPACYEAPAEVLP